MEHHFWCTEGDSCECDEDDRYPHTDGCELCGPGSQREHDRLMNERARLILDGIDPDQLATPISPLPPLDHPWHP